MKNAVRAFAVDGEIDGQHVVVAQIEIDCDECQTLRFIIPGHHLKTVRDVVIDLLDQFPDLGGERTLTKTSTIAIKLDGQKAGMN